VVETINDPQVAEDAETFDANIEAQAKVALHDMLTTYGGRVLLWELLGECMIYRDDVYQGEATHNTAFGLGRRHVGLALMQKIMDANPNAYAAMTRESADRQEYINNLKGEDNG
tara:strand:+ start:4976 stop:5317 length:342 start_codon:yes stop_codon:yes gene_type:complete